MFRKLELAEEILIRKNGEEALFYLSAQTKGNIYAGPELIVLDNHMPVMDGIEMAERLNIYMPDFINSLSIIAISATEVPHEREQLYKLGIREFYLKPLTEAKVMEIYHRICGSRQDTVMNSYL